MSQKKNHKLFAGLFCAVLAVLAPVCDAQVQPDFTKVDVTPRKIAENFYVIDETPVHGGAVSILTGPDGIMLVDTGVEGLAARVEAEIRRLSPQPIRYVIGSHAHVDEIGGNVHFAQLGATLIGRDLMRSSILHPKIPAAGAVVDGRQARQARAPSIAGAPTITFKTEMGLHFDGQDVRLLAIPRAHTDSDTIVIFPGLDIIVVGDVLRAHEYPSIGRPDGGSLAGMLDGLSLLISLAGPQTRFVTSHGQIVDRTAVSAQRDLLITTRDRIAARMAQGQSLDEILAAKVTEGLGAHAEPGHISADAFVRDVYNELKATP
jgi:glyoxylase-like metal-dependent hydrolase (beta-lactamase superfamily II)